LVWFLTFDGITTMLDFSGIEQARVRCQRWRRVLAELTRSQLQSIPMDAYVVVSFVTTYLLRVTDIQGIAEGLDPGTDRYRILTLAIAISTRSAIIRIANEAS
jgi:hypothetical protein